MNYNSIFIFCCCLLSLITVNILNKYANKFKRHKMAGYIRILNSIMPLLCMIFSAFYTHNLFNRAKNSHDIYTHRIKLIGNIPQGINMFRIPKLNFNFIVRMYEALPIAFVAFLESYSIAKRLAIERSKLNYILLNHILNLNIFIYSFLSFIYLLFIYLFIQSFIHLLYI